MYDLSSMLGHKIYLFIALIASANGHISGQEEDLPVVEFEWRGKQIRVPFYEKRDPISDVKHDFDRNLITNVGTIVKSMSEDALVTEGNIITTTNNLLSHGFNLISECNRSKAKLIEMRKADARVGKSTKPGYMIEMGGLVRDILDYDVCSPKTLPKEAQPEWCHGKKPSKEVRKEHVERIGNYLDIFVEIVDRNPLGVYVNWRELTVDGVPITKLFGEETSFFRKCGYSAIIKILGWLSSSLKKM